FDDMDDELAIQILKFLDHVYPLVDSSVSRYIERGFTSLMISFGCTGGQHRSVYCAQHLAEHISKKYGVQVDLVHREQNIEQSFPAK
ncbi:MAG: phosphotransferase, partial [Muribaculaceae bacterium]